MAHAEQLAVGKKVKPPAVRARGILHIPYGIVGHTKLLLLYGGSSGALFLLDVPAFAQPGVIAAVSETLAEAGVSIESFLQKPVENAEGVPIVLTTHAVAESVLTTAIDRIADLPSVLERPRLLRIARI